MGHGAMDQHDGFAFVEVFRGGFVCVCVCVCVLLGGLIGNGGLGCGFAVCVFCLVGLLVAAMVEFFFFFLVVAWVVGRGGKFYPYL